MKRQKALTDSEWLQRCDELAQQQPTMFFELLIFLRDGVPLEHGRNLIDYLSVLQFASQEASEAVSLFEPMLTRVGLNNASTQIRTRNN